MQTWDYLDVMWDAYTGRGASVGGQFSPRKGGVFQSVRDVFRELGDQGWELVNVYHDGTNNWAWFKRPKADQEGSQLPRS